MDDLFDKKKLIYFEPSNYRKKNHYTNKYRYGLKLQLENSDLLIIEQATLRYERKSEKLLTQKYLTESLKYIYDIYKKPILIVSNNNVVSNITNKLLEKKLKLENYLNNIEKKNQINENYPFYFLHPKLFLVILWIQTLLINILL